VIHIDAWAHFIPQAMYDNLAVFYYYYYYYWYCCSMYRAWCQIQLI